MRQVVPGITVRTIILAHRSPLPVAKVWSPQVPALFLRIIFFNPPLFSVHGESCRLHSGKSKSGMTLSLPRFFAGFLSIGTSVSDIIRHLDARYKLDFGAPF